MKAAVREVLGLARVERALGFLRERHAELMLNGRPPGPDQIRTDEQRAITEAWRTLHDPATVLLFGDGPDAPVGDGGKLGQQMLIDTHHLMAAIPLVGDPLHADQAHTDPAHTDQAHA